MHHLACIDLRTEWDILDVSGPVPLFQRVRFGGGEHEGSPVMPPASLRLADARDGANAPPLRAAYPPQRLAA